MHPQLRRRQPPSCREPILQVPTGWKIVVPISPALRIRSSSLSILRAGQHLFRRKARDRTGLHRAGGHGASMRRRRCGRRRWKDSSGWISGPTERSGPPTCTRPPAFRPQIADGDGDRGKVMQRLAEPVGAQRLHVIFEIGGRNSADRSWQRCRAGSAPSTAARTGAAHIQAPCPRG